MNQRRLRVEEDRKKRDKGTVNEKRLEEEDEIIHMGVDIASDEMTKMIGRLEFMEEGDGVE